MYTLRKYQLETVERAQQQNLLIADDCGLGKTITAIESCAKLMHDDPYGRTLIVCPKKLIDQWVGEIFDQVGPQWPIYILNQVPVDLTRSKGWFIIHYDILPKALYLTDVIWTVIVADEAHRLRNRTNKWTVAIKKPVAGRYIAMTATPQDRYPSEVWSILNFIHARGLPLYWGFQKKYEEWDRQGPFPKYVGIQNEKEFGHWLSTYVVRHTKSQVAPELPEHIIVPVSVAMEPAQEKAYRQIKDMDDIEVDVEGIDEALIIQNVLVKLVRLQQMSTDPSLLGLNCLSGKIEWLKEFLSDHQNEKTVVFTRWRDTAKALCNRFGGALVIGGQKPVGLESFQNGNVNRLFGTIASMGVGLNLPMAKYAVYLDMEWSSLLMQQAYDRIHRMNITEPKVSYILLSSHVDRHIKRAVDHKWNEREMVMEFIQSRFNNDIPD